MWDNLCGCGMDIMAVYNYDKARLLRFTRNDRRKNDFPPAMTGEREVSHSQ
ncbi:MAG: hypothetical protein BROFUL_01517 [Candidatus Brocadia fulgida]|uniref:Uncharacterized protein n=1 Tax=Candidatus Brocadia fulgida TaxID=380242 RepID=A0A0M2UW40_9BACT|nr:MAG: hypothetical protein BROFUL_01517 [Candidatus Brocadia fulgida]